MNNNFRELNGILCTTIKLNAWEDFFGFPIEVQVNLGGDSLVEGVQERHILTLNFFIDNQLNILEKMLDSLYKEYDALKEEYDYDEFEKQEYMPDVSSIRDFKALISIRRIHILDIQKNGLCYIGFQFDCKWDAEQGLGFMTHENRVVKMGGADCSFMSWIADEDINGDKI